jgi:hypothetical protein
MDGVPAEGWQLVQGPDRLAVLLAGVPDFFDDDGLAERLAHELRSPAAIWSWRQDSSWGQAGGACRSGRSVFVS